MERSRSKRSSYYYDQDYDGENMARTKPRYNHHYTGNPNRHRGSANSAGIGNGRPSKPAADSTNLMVTTTYRILCHDVKAGGVIGKSGSIIKSIRQHTGAWINVHELIPGDAERIIEISDTRRRDPDGRMPAFSPAQEALCLVHDRILESEPQFGYGGGPEEEEDYGGVRSGGGRVVTRLVVSRMHVGCLMGKQGKIIEHMRSETKTHIRILPRDHKLPRCVSMSEEIVQVVGDANAVKNAIEIISSRLRESQHRDRGYFHGRLRSPEQFIPPEDDFMPQGSNAYRRPPMDGFGKRFSNISYRVNSLSSRQSNYATEAATGSHSESERPMHGEELVFRMLCPDDKVDRVFGESRGIIGLLQNEIGVNVGVAGSVAGSDEQILVISSAEAPDDELFPAQEALLHIQTCIVDLAPDKENIITTKLLVQSSDIGYLDGRDGSLSDVKRSTGADIQILPREDHTPCMSAGDKIVQIVGEIKAARNALVELTSRLKSNLYKDFYQKASTPPSASAFASAPPDSGVESASFNNITHARETHATVCASISAPASKEASGSDTARQSEIERREDGPSTANRIPITHIARSTHEVVIPEQAASKLVTKTKNKLTLISELSGANVTLVEGGATETQKIVRISGAPDQAERAQSLLQGFILSIQEDEP